MKRRILAVLLGLSMIVLAACGTKPTPGGQTTEAAKTTAAEKAGDKTEKETEKATEPAADGQVTIRTTFLEGELSRELLDKFEAENPGIKVVQEAVDDTKMASLLATQDAPDVMRCIGVYDIPTYVTRRIALDLDELMNNSKVIDVDDLLPICHVYRYDGTTVGKGPWYGLPKDWSNDFALFYNKTCFDNANVDLPSDTEPMTWNEVVDLAKKLVIKEGDTTVQYGLAMVENPTMPSFYYLNQYLLSAGEDLSSDDNKSMDFTKPVVGDFLTLWNDAVKSNIGPNPVNNDQTGGSNLFIGDQCAMIVTGYWYSGMIRGNEEASKKTATFGMLPTPMVEGGKRVAPTGSATGGFIYAQTKHKEEAWKFFEWYFGGEPVDDRAKSGWGLPSFRSKMELLPQADDFDKQVYRVTLDELNYGDAFIPINPYLGKAGRPMFEKWVDPFIFDRATLEETMQGMTDDANQTISEMVSVLEG
ncbi:MAG: sugar ABC transporter substrate-binding protein [Bacillota bacterium]|nr:sugar ABC transporter substrate-binding protein [Bacillota bacterium]